MSRRTLRPFSVLAIFLLLILLQSAYAKSLADIRAMASSPEPGDYVGIWVPGGFWTPPTSDDRGITWQNCTWPSLVVARRDGTTIRFEPNFWNIVGASGENYMRFISSEEKVVFYAKLADVSTMWGGIAWATPEVLIAGRPPPQFAVVDPVGGYPWFSLPIRVVDFLAQYKELYVLAKYEVTYATDTLARWGFILWFENPGGAPIAEIYIAFSDEFGGWVGDKTVIGTLAKPFIVDGELFTGVFEVQRALSGGGWAAFVFLLTNAKLVNNTVVIDIRPFIEIAFNEMVNYFSVSPEDVVWGFLAIGSYMGSTGTGLEIGWILHDARLLPPELAPKIIAVTVTETLQVVTTKTMIELREVTTTVKETTKVEETTTVTTRVTEPDYTVTAVVGVVALVIGVIAGYMVRRK